MQSTATGEIVIPEESEVSLLVMPPPFESSAIAPPLVTAPPPTVQAPPPAPPPPPYAPLPEGLNDLQDVARQVRVDFEALHLELVGERERLATERRTLEADRASVERAHVALAKLTGSFADARAKLLEEVRVEVAMECEGRLAAQRRELSQERERLEGELEATQRRLARAQAQLVRSTEWLREEGAAEKEPEPKAPTRRAPSRRRTRRRF